MTKVTPCPVCNAPGAREFLRRSHVPVHQNLVIASHEEAVRMTRGELATARRRPSSSACRGQRRVGPVPVGEQAESDLHVGTIAIQDSPAAVGFETSVQACVVA